MCEIEKTTWLDYSFSFSMKMTKTTQFFIFLVTNIFPVGPVTVVPSMHSLINHFEVFFDAVTHLYMRVCPSVRTSVRSMLVKIVEIFVLWSGYSEISESPGNGEQVPARWGPCPTVVALHLLVMYPALFSWFLSIVVLIGQNLEPQIRVLFLFTFNY